VLPHHPRRHASLILNDGGLQRVNHLPVQIVQDLREQRFIDELSFRAVRQ
jgi:hypothetical protein